MQLINVPVIRNPVNWAIVVLMLIFAGIAGHYVMTLAGIEPANGG